MNNDSFSKNTSKTFLKGAMIMTVSMVVVKVLGMLYKIFLYQSKSGNKARVMGRPENANWKRKVTYPTDKYHLTKIRPGTYEVEYNEAKHRLEVDLRKPKEKKQIGMI